MKNDKSKLMITLLLNTVILLTLYFFLSEKLQFPYVAHIYFAAGAILALYYVIYNRGFVGKGATPDMLPDTMSMAEKEAFLTDCKERQKKSRWVLVILFPIILTFIADISYLFLLPMLTGGAQ